MGRGGRERERGSAAATTSRACANTPKTTFLPHTFRSLAFSPPPLQHLAEALDPSLTPLEYIMQEFQGTQLEAARGIVGRFGITGKMQTLPMSQLSDGLRSRVVFAWLAKKTPHILLLDEPTNHLDIETIDSLASAINEWDGGLVLVSHDFRLIGQVAQEIWVVADGTVAKWPGSILSYKAHLKKTHAALAESGVKAKMVER